MVEPRIKLTCDEPTRAQLSYSNCGPAVGVGHDLCIWSGCLSNSRSYAEPGYSYGRGQDDNVNHFNALGYFQVTEYEVFAVK